MRSAPGCLNDSDRDDVGAFDQVLSLLFGELLYDIPLQTYRHGWGIEVDELTTSIPLHYRFDRAPDDHWRSIGLPREIVHVCQHAACWTIDELAILVGDGHC